jgi:predicted NBD/HSP70 family sugar kinase
MPSRENKTTFVIDIGGTGVKGMLLDSAAKPISERQRFDTPDPAVAGSLLAKKD